MPAPRKYTDAQRQALFRLHEGGMTSREIAEACAEGRTGLARFTISPRTVRDIVAKMEEQAHRQLPATVLDLEHGEAMQRFPARAARILDRELDRLSAKQAKSGLTEKDAEMIPRLVASSARVEKALQDRGKQRKTRRGTGERAGEPTRDESALERLARERREGDTAEVHVGHTRTHRDDDEAAEPATASPHSEPPESADMSSLEERRQEAAQRARAALAAG